MIGRRQVLTTAAAAASFATPAPALTPKPMRLLILGGTGFTGPHQVRYALSRGHKVTVFNRGRRPQDWPGEVEELTGDRNTSDLKSLAGREWDVCIDNPTTLPFWVRDAGATLKGKVKHYVFISTISVYAANDQAGADETAPVQMYRGDDPFAVKVSDNSLYGPLKATSEAEARRQFGEAATTVIRPGLIVGPGDETDRFTCWPVRLARGGGGPDLPGATTHRGRDAGLVAHAAGGSAGQAAGGTDGRAGSGYAGRLEGEGMRTNRMKTLIGAAVLALASALPAAAQAPAEPPPAQGRFKCDNGRDLTAQFASRDAQFVAIVDAGDGPHALPLRPWTGGPAKITWSDGRRTLTWSPGVTIHWTDGGVHRLCGRSGGHKH